MLGVHPWQVALFPDEAQQAVWGSDQSARLSSSYAPTGKATETDGGYLLSGRWSFSSGSAHASWVLLGGLVFSFEADCPYLLQQTTQRLRHIPPPDNYTLVWEGSRPADRNEHYRLLRVTR